MPHLSNEEFLGKLKSLFEAQKEIGSVFISQKFYVPENVDNSENLTPMCLYRATNGKNIKIATLVAHDDVADFHARYSVIGRENMDALIRIKKSKRKTKATQNVTTELESMKIE